MENLPAHRPPTAPSEPPALAYARRPASPEDLARPPLSFASRLGLFVVLVLGVAYILNPTLGLFEFIPDNLPIVGNLDEAGATALVIWAGRELFFRRRSAR